jgi:Uri superfamily endonuclease
VDSFPRLGSEGGTYVLLFEIQTPLENRLGRFHGHYCYVGSAFGPGGLRARVTRHLRKDKPIQWHMDLLTGGDSFRALSVNVTPERTECSLAQRLSTSLEGHPDFGSSDCRCRTHLFRVRQLDSFRSLMGELGMARPDLPSPAPPA